MCTCITCALHTNYLLPKLLCTLDLAKELLLAACLLFGVPLGPLLRLAVLVLLSLASFALLLFLASFFFFLADFFSCLSLAAISLSAAFRFLLLLSVLIGLLAAGLSGGKAGVLPRDVDGVDDIALASSFGAGCCSSICCLLLAGLSGGKAGVLPRDVDGVDDIALASSFGAGCCSSICCLLLAGLSGGKAGVLPRDVDGVDDIALASSFAAGCCSSIRRFLLVRLSGGEAAMLPCDVDGVDVTALASSFAAGCCSMLSVMLCCLDAPTESGDKWVVREVGCKLKGTPRAFGSCFWYCA